MSYMCVALVSSILSLWSRSASVGCICAYWVVAAKCPSAAASCSARLCKFSAWRPPPTSPSRKVHHTHTTARARSCETIARAVEASHLREKHAATQDIL